MQDRYDVAFSLNGSDQGTLDAAEAITSHLQRHGLKVFFYRDPEEAERSLGSNLQERLPRIYGEQSRLVILVASPTYGCEGLTTLEWEAIRNRQARFPDDSFLISVATVEPDRLPEGVRDRVYVESQRGKGEPWPEPVVRVVLRRLGRWPLLKSVVYHGLLLLAVALVFWQLANTTYSDLAGMTLTYTTVVFSIVWWLGFRIAPRTWPALVYAPRTWLTKVYQRIYLNLIAERLAFIGVLFLAALAHITLPSLDKEMNDGMKNWFGGTSAERAVALNFFRERVEQQASLQFWTTVLVDETRYGDVERGKALDMVYRLSFAEEKAKPDITGGIRSFAEKRLLGLHPDNWPSSLSGIDASGLTLDQSILARMHFAGRETDFSNTHITQADFSGTYWQAVNLSGSDLRWSHFPLASFLGIEGQANFSGAHLQGTTFFECDLRGASFFGADLTGAHFQSCRLAGADFTNAHLTGVVFDDSDLTGARFTVDEVRWGSRWGNLAGVSFIGCTMGGVVIAGADFRARELTLYRAKTPDPSNLNALSNVYARDPELPGTELELEATVPIPPTRFANVRFRDYELPAAFSSPQGVDLTGVQAKGLLIDQATFSRLSESERRQLKEAGLELDGVFEDMSESHAWARVVTEVLDPLFETASRN